MAILGLLLVLSAAAVTLDVVSRNSESISVDVIGQAVSLDAGWFFVAGVATGAVAMLGLAMVVGSLARARRRRAALVESRSSVQGLQTERDRLAEQLQRERAERTSAPTTSRQHRTERRSAANDGGDDESDVIHLEDERRDDPDLSDSSAERRGARRDPVASGRHGLFHRRR